MKLSTSFALILLFIISCSSQQQGEDSDSRAYTRSGTKMGSSFSVTVIAEDSIFASDCLEKAYAEIDRIEQLISSWDPASQASAINRNAGVVPVQVDPELYLLIERSLKVSGLTGGAFDISFASMDRIWKFDGSMTAFPSEKALKGSVEKVNYKDIVLDDDYKSVFLKNEGMKIGFGGIGKGYAGNKVKSLLRDLGVSNGVVNAGGDLIAWGRKPDGQPWDVAIADPKNPKKPLGWLVVNDMAVVTSGNYERFALIDGVRYSHIINPRTGIPVTGLKSVTIVCPDAEVADALATGVFVMGKEKGLLLIDQLNGVEALLITDEDQVLTSKGLSLNYYE